MKERNIYIRTHTHTHSLVFEALCGHLTGSCILGTTLSEGCAAVKKFRKHTGVVINTDVTLNDESDQGVVINTDVTLNDESDQVEFRDLTRSRFLGTYQVFSH